ncbi:MAG: hypothetical protein LJE68_14095 [Rhodobacter sp.]|jgi:hypothetical protein|nr:hypothetical protein [Rhodobacter sp.]
MAHFNKRLAKLILPAAAVSLSVFGLAAGSKAHSNDDGAEPVDCEIAVSKGRYGHTYEGVIHANSTTRGTYELNIKKRGTSGRAMISQSGDFYVTGGKSETLGQATFGGLPPASVEAELIIHYDGHTMACSNQSEI